MDMYRFASFHTFFFHLADRLLVGSGRRPVGCRCFIYLLSLCADGDYGGSNDNDGQHW